MHLVLVVLLQDVTGSTPPWLYLGMAGALAAMGTALLTGGKTWIDKCETRAAGHLARVDKMIEANAENNAALKDANANAARATDIAERLLTGLGAANAQLAEQGKQIAEQGKHHDALRASVASIDRAFEDFARTGDPPTRRRP